MVGWPSASMRATMHKLHTALQPATPLQEDVIGQVVPHALKKYDLPDLEKLLGDKLTVE